VDQLEDGSEVDIGKLVVVGGVLSTEGVDKVIEVKSFDGGFDGVKKSYHELVWQWFRCFATFKDRFKAFFSANLDGLILFSSLNCIR